MNSFNKKVVVTGTTSGIGKAVVELLKTEGVNVIEIDRSKVDFAKPDAKEKIDQILAGEQDIDALVHSAGFADPDESFHKLDTLDQTLNVNLLSSIYLTRAVLSNLNEKAKLIFVSSTAGIIGSGKVPLYATSKGAVNSFAQSLAFYFKFNNTQNQSFAVAPGPTNTPMRVRTSGDADNHQGPEVVAKTIVDMVLGKSSYKNGDIVIVSDGKEKLSSSLAD